MIKPKLIHDCGSLTGWTPVYLAGTGNVEIDSTFKDRGNASWKITTPAASYGQAGVEKEVDLDLTDKSILFKIAKDSTNPVMNFIVKLYNGTKYALWKFGLTDIMANDMFYYAMLNRSDALFMEGFTDDDFASITKMNLQFMGNGGTTADIGWIDSIEIVKIVKRPIFTFRFDTCTTNSVTISTIAKKVLDEYGYKASVMVQTNQIGTTGKLTLTQLQDMKDSGWDIGSHSHTHPYFTSLTDEQALTEITTSEGILEDASLLTSPKLFAHPFSKPTKYSMEQLKARGYITSGIGPGYSGNNTLGVTGGVISYHVPHPNFLDVGSNGLFTNYDTVAIETFEDILDLSKGNDEWLVALIHTVSDEDKFRDLVGAIHDSGFEVMTISEVYNITKSLRKSVSLRNSVSRVSRS